MILATCVMTGIAASSAQAAVISVTVADATEEKIVLSDGNGAYFDDWMLLHSPSTSLQIFNQKAGATNIATPTLNQATSSQTNQPWMFGFDYTAVDAASGPAGSNIRRVVKVGVNGGVVDFTVNINDIGSSGVAGLIAGSNLVTYKITATIGSDINVFTTLVAPGNDDVVRYAITYSGVTDLAATLNIKMESTATSGFRDFKFQAVTLADVVPVPEPTTMALMGLGGITLLARRRRA